MHSCAALDFERGHLAHFLLKEQNRKGARILKDLAIDGEQNVSRMQARAIGGRARQYVFEDDSGLAVPGRARWRALA